MIQLDIVPAVESSPISNKFRKIDSKNIRDGEHRE